VAASREVRRILVCKFRSPGDVLLLVPALKALKRGFPEASITAAVNADCAPLIELHPAVDRVLGYARGPREGSWLVRAGLELAYFRQAARRFDLAVNATEGDRGTLLTLVSGARLRVGLDQAGTGARALKRRLYTHLLPPWPKGRHNVLCNLDLVGLLGIDTSDRAVELATSAEDDEAVRQALEREGIGEGEPLVHVHAPSRPYKRWTLEGMAEVIDFLQLERGLRVALSGAPPERPYVEGIAQLCRCHHGRSRPAVLAGRLSLRQTGALARRASLFFGVDTVAMHLAAAAGTPVVALFGPSVATAWGPWDNAGPQAPYHGPSGVQHSGPHVIIQPSKACVQPARACVPCGNMGCGRSGRSACLEELTSAEVIPVLDAALTRHLPRLA